MPNQLVVEEIDEHEAYFQIIGSRFPHIEERLRLMWGVARSGGRCFARSNQGRDRQS